MPGVESQTVLGCENIHTNIHKRADRQDLRDDKQDEKIDKIQNRLPNWAVVIQNILIAAVSVMGTLLAIKLGG